MDPVSRKEIRIRQFTLQDFEGLTALWDEAGLPYKPHGRDCREAIELEMKRGMGTFLLAEEDGRIVGSVLVTMDGRKGWINRLAVAPSRRRLGIARLLIEEAEKQLREAGMRVTACLIETENQNSMSLFEAMGYKRQDRIIYFVKKEDEEA